MAENSKVGLLAKAQKRISRTKTKVLQNLGKAERTTDEIFDDLVQRIEKQQEVAHHLQKELKNYLHCVRSLTGANKLLCEGIAQVYEPEWTEEKGFKESLECYGLLWTDITQKLTEKAFDPLNNYLASFPPLKAKINKRGRKQVDYDNARHNLEVLQNAKKRDEAKIAKAQEELAECKKIYEELNNELHNELPDFYNSRVTFFANLFQDLYSSENTFFIEMGKVSNGLQETSSRLAKDSEHFAYKPEPHRPLSKVSSEMDEESPLYNGGEETASGGSPASRTSASKAEAAPQENDGSSSPVYLNQDQVEEDVSLPCCSSADQGEDGSMVNGDEAEEEDKRERHSSGGAPSFPAPGPPAERSAPPAPEAADPTEEDDEDLDGNVYDEPKPVHGVEAGDYEVPPSNKPLSTSTSLTSPPPGFLYEVVSTHPYKGEDVDELNFGPGETIYVVPYDDPEEQDAGWQMGVRQLNGTKGVFPENFTKRV